MLETIAQIGCNKDTARQAAELWSQAHFTPGRHVGRVVTKPGLGPLSIEFRLDHGFNWYICQWDDKLKQFRIMQDR